MPDKVSKAARLAGFVPPRGRDHRVAERVLVEATPKTARFDAGTRGIGDYVRCRGIAS